jgi:hypothetical protein
MVERMRKVRGLFALVLLVLVSSSVLAYTTIEVDTIDNRILFGERARFSVNLRNDEAETQTYEIFSPTSGLSWSVVTKPLRNREMTLAPNTSGRTEVVVEPVNKFRPGVYSVNLDIVSSRGESYREPLTVYIGTDEVKGYLPSLRITIDMNENIDPRDVQSIKVFVENLNPLDLNGTIVRVISDIPQYNLEQTIDLEPSSQRAVEFTIDLDDTQQPKEYVLFFQFEKDDQIIKVLDKRIEVIPLTIPFGQKTSEDKSFLRTQRNVVVRNNGNVRNTQTVVVPIGVIARLFTTSEPDSVYISEDGRKGIGWEVNLGPGQETTVKTVTTYRVPFVVIVLLLIGVLLYVVYRNPLTIMKSASNVVMKEGGVSSLKVTVAIKNLSNSTLKNVEIHDEVPSIAHIEKDIEMGTLKPNQILRGHNGQIIIKWKLSELEGKEERLISYKIKSKLNIVGTLKLPRVKATFQSGAKKRVSFSNVYRVSTGE